jgi:CheY-like chemotaxis protein/Flp pilus assembly protein TadD
MPPTILCAQDDRNLYQIHQRALADEGFRVLGVHDGEQALTTARDEEPDLVLLDSVLPKRDGFSVLKAIRGESGRMPIVLLCAGRISDEFRRRAEQLGDVALLSKPVPLDELVGQVREFIEDKQPAPAHRQMALPEKGSLRQIHLGALLHALHARGESGVLLLEYGKKKKAVQLREGYPVAVKSNLVTECLGNLLISRGKLTEQQVDESIRRVKRGEGLQGEILVAMDLLDEDDVATALRDQAEAKLFEIFEWKGGSFVFQRGRRLQRANSLSLDGSPAEMVVRASRRHVNLARVDGFLEQHADAFVAVADDPFSRFQSIDLNEGEQRMLEELDGKRSLGDFMNASERMRRTFYALLMVELLVLHGDAGSSPGLQPRRAETTAGQTGPQGDDRALRKELTALARELREKNHYEVLGIPTTADDATVKKAYEAQIQRVHPDRYRNSSGAVRQVADEIHRLVTTAYETLCEQQGRAEYATVLKQGAAERREQERGRKALAAETVFQRGEAALRARDYEGALVFFGSAMEQMPDEGEYHAHYGWCLHLCHPDNEVIVQEAVEHVQRGVKLARDRERPYLYLGRLYKVMGRMAAAEKMFTRAVQIRSDCVEALRELRLLNMRRDKNKGLIGKLLRR